MINVNKIIKNILKHRKDKLESKVINKEENKKRLEKYKKSKQELINSSDFRLKQNKQSTENSIIEIPFDIECQKYYELMELYAFHDQGKMNNYISQNNLWDKFPTIRAYNTHGDIGNIKGITPKAYAKVCRLLGRSMRTNGQPLVDSKRY